MTFTTDDEGITVKQHIIGHMCGWLYWTSLE